MKEKKQLCSVSGDVNVILYFEFRLTFAQKLTNPVKKKKISPC